MKKILLTLGVLFVVQLTSAASLRDYVQSVEKISEDYHQQSRAFLKSLNPQQQGFTADQQKQFCGIVTNYVDRLYKATDKNREALDFQLQKMTREDIVNQVNASQMMKLLQSKNVNCSF